MTLSTDTSGFVPPETRFTEEYKDFLASQDATSQDATSQDATSQDATSQDAIASVKRENENICEDECTEYKSVSEKTETAPGDSELSENTEDAADIQE